MESMICYDFKDVEKLMLRFGVSVRTIQRALRFKDHSMTCKRIRSFAVNHLKCGVML